jgi:fatty acid desaturase
MTSTQTEPNLNETVESLRRVGEKYRAINKHWISKATFTLIAVSLVLSQIGIGFAVYQGSLWLGIPMVILASHFMHGALIGFHEASHSLLRKNRLLNDIDGVVAGTLSFMSFTLYRVAHQTHHMHLATERDEELWPFVKVDSPRWFRCWIAFVELNAGLFFTPFLFARMFLRKDSFIRNKKVRRQIWGEFAIMGLFWSLVISAVAYWNVWNYFFWIFFVPGYIAGNLQSWRKYVEHVGVRGHTANGATRSIVSHSWGGRLLSLTLLHEPFHAVHHWKAGLPHEELPLNAELLAPAEKDDLPIFPNYRSAIIDLLRNLSDPRTGSHWPDPKAKTIS